MIKLANILEDMSDKRKHLKAARDVANEFARRGHDPIEAVNYAAVSVKHMSGYDLTPEDKEILKKVVYVHPNFK